MSGREQSEDGGDPGGRGAACPAPIDGYAQIVLGHGSGGRLSARLLERVFLAGLGGETLARLEDAAEVSLGGARLAFTTDAFVVSPIFFPGGDLGTLAVCGTVNDLAVSGAVPRFLSAAFVLEEGLPIDDLARVVASMRAACASAGVELVAGDTKVVERGKGDGLYVTTSGIGLIPAGRALSVRSARPGDAVIVSGTLGDHGIAIMAAREGLALETTLSSDVAPLADLCAAMLEACPSIRWMRDPTRGGLSSALHELAVASGVSVRLEEAAIPIRPEVEGACELLGLDPLYVANEGKLVAAVPAEDAERLLEVVRAHPRGADAARVGEIVEAPAGMVTMRSRIGGERVVSMLAGEQLPRIC